MLGWPVARPCVLFPAARADRSKAMNKRADIFDAMIERLRPNVAGRVRRQPRRPPSRVGRPGDERRRRRGDHVAAGGRTSGREGGARVSRRRSSRLRSVTSPPWSTACRDARSPRAIPRRWRGPSSRRAERSARSPVARVHAGVRTSADRRARASGVSPRARRAAASDDRRAPAESRVRLPEPRGGRRRAAVGDSRPRTGRAGLRRARDHARRPRPLLRRVARPRRPDRLRAPAAPRRPDRPGACRPARRDAVMRRREPRRERPPGRQRPRPNGSVPRTSSRSTWGRTPSECARSAGISSSCSAR